VLAGISPIDGHATRHPVSVAGWIFAGRFLWGGAMTEHKFTAADYMDEAEAAERGGAWKQAAALWLIAATSPDVTLPEYVDCLANRRRALRKCSMVHNIF
jgi:hypothetical protein